MLLEVNIVKTFTNKISSSKRNTVLLFKSSTNHLCKESNCGQTIQSKGQRTQVFGDEHSLDLCEQNNSLKPKVG